MKKVIILFKEKTPHKIMNKEKRLKLKNHLPLVRDSSAVPEIIKYKIRPESNTKTALQVS